MDTKCIQDVHLHTLTLASTRARLRMVPREDLGHEETVCEVALHVSDTVAEG